jgi:hypothetical protein
VITTILENKKLRAHPSILICFICIMEACFVFTALINSPALTFGYITCYFHLDTLWKYTTFGMFDADIQFFNWSGFWFMGYLQLAQMISNICLCHDLIKTLQSPFDVASNRLKWYVALSLLVPFFVMANVMKPNLVRN